MSILNFEEVDDLLQECKGTEAYQLLISMKNNSNQNDVGLNWRLGQACYILANCSKEEESRAFVLRGHGYIVQAYEKAPRDTNVLKLAVVLKNFMYSNAIGIKERLKHRHEFKKYIDEAIEHLPEDFAFFHLRGRFRYEVASLSFIERGVASVFFATPPSATYQEALDDLLKAEEMDSGAIDNMLYLGKTYKALGNDAEARRWFIKSSFYYGNKIVNCGINLGGSQETLNDLNQLDDGLNSAFERQIRILDTTNREFEESAKFMDD